MVRKNGGSTQRDNFIMVPRIIHTLDLDPFAYRVYGQLKDFAGEKGVCWPKTITLARTCRMSVGKVTAAKKDLVKAGVIRIVKVLIGRQYHDSITLVDIWHRNHAMYHQVALPVKTTDSPGERVNSTTDSSGERVSQGYATPNGTSKNGTTDSPGERVNGTTRSRPCVTNKKEQGTTSEQDNILPPPNMSEGAPEFWKPMGTLEGYRHVRNGHEPFIKILQQSCAAAGVSHALVVERFVQDYPVLKYQYGWTDPVKALRKTLNIQISKSLNLPGAKTRGHHNSFRKLNQKMESSLPPLTGRVI